MKPPLHIQQEDLTWPPDWSFELADGRRVSGREFTRDWAGLRGRYPIYRGGRKIGTYTNLGPLDDIKRIVHQAKKLGL